MQGITLGIPFVHSLALEIGCNLRHAIFIAVYYNLLQYLLPAQAFEWVVIRDDSAGAIPAILTLPTIVVCLKV